MVFFSIQTQPIGKKRKNQERIFQLKIILAADFLPVPIQKVTPGVLLRGYFLYGGLHRDLLCSTFYYIINCIYTYG